MKKIFSNLAIGAALLIFGATPVIAAGITIGNDTTARANTDTYTNFTIIDTNHPAESAGDLKTFSYYAATTNPFRFVVVDGSKMVQWVSDQITPASTGVNIFTPVDPVHVEKDWNVGLYFTSTGTVPFNYDSTAEPIYWSLNNSGLPQIGDLINNQEGYGPEVTNRIYSFVATSASVKSNLLTEQWRIFNVKPATASYWDINKVKTIAGGALQFPIQRFESPGAGSFAVYLLNNYNVDLTDKTLAVTASWTPGTYNTRSNTGDAYVRFWFQDVASGPYDVNDYWWSTGLNSLDLNGGSSGSLNVSLKERSRWTNMARFSATDCDTDNYTDWNGTKMKDTPCVGFDKAMKNVKQMGLSFGNASRYASGVARVEEMGFFTVSSFTVTQ